MVTDRTIEPWRRGTPEELGVPTVWWTAAGEGRLFLDEVRRRWHRVTAFTPSALWSAHSVCECAQTLFLSWSGKHERLNTALLRVYFGGKQLCGGFLTNDCIDHLAGWEICIHEYLICGRVYVNMYKCVVSTHYSYWPQLTHFIPSFFLSFVSFLLSFFLSSFFLPFISYFLHAFSFQSSYFWVSDILLSLHSPPPPLISCFFPPCVLFIFSHFLSFFFLSTL